MHVESSFTIAEAERVIRGMEGRGTDTTLTLPTHSRSNVGGGEPAVVQAVLTWASTQINARIGTYANGPEDSQLESLTRHLVGLCAALVSNEATDADGRDLTAALNKLAVERLRGLQSLEPQRWSRGSQVEILCADHLGWTTPETLYAASEPSKRLLSRKEFDRVAGLILQQTVANYIPAHGDEALKAGLADALYELFRNTDEYARTDERGNRVKHSIRGIHARRQAISRPGLAKMVEASPPLATYCERLTPRQGRRDIQLLEVSVFDAGPGYAPRWLKRPLAAISREQELDAIMTCFGKHATGKDDSSAGMGLCTVVDILRQGKGFMRLRTGRHSLYADLALEAGRPYGELPQLRPWRELGFAPAAGTLFTMILPL